MRVTLRQLRYFKAVVDNGSFARAAESVFVSQPALSLQVRELETTLGWPLFKRDSHGVALTALGREVHTQALRVIDEALLLEALGRRFNEGPFAIELGIVSTLAPYLVAGLQDELGKIEERIDFTLHEATSRQLLDQLLGGHIDAAVISLPVGKLELTERELFEDPLLLAGSPSRLAAFRNLADGPKAENLAMLDLGPLLVLSEGHCLGEQLLGACGKNTPEGVQRNLESLGSLARLANTGAGLTLIPATAAAAEQAASPELEFLRLADPEPKRKIGLVHRVAFQDQRWIKGLGDAAARAGERLIKQSRPLVS
ncbi:MAG: LysR substrate-binding domain-containing protein [Gammaproteobacteria bacterium]|nr:LysR substrate-binding domain-containing protein [Gammaproteobacteria bacterium]